jgi:hypothetical protein
MSYAFSCTIDGAYMPCLQKLLKESREKFESAIKINITSVCPDGNLAILQVCLFPRYEKNYIKIHNASRCVCLSMSCLLVHHAMLRASPDTPHDWQLANAFYMDHLFETEDEEAAQVHPLRNHVVHIHMLSI